MGLKNAALLAGAWLAMGGMAFAQVDNGTEVTVNPVAMGGGVLLYPGGQYVRVVPQLRQPGDTGRPIVLHMPSRHPRAATHAAEAAAAPPAPRKVAKAKPAPAPAAPLAEGPPPPNSAASLFDTMAPPVSAPAQAAPPTRVARAEPAPAETSSIAGLSKRSMILFAPNAPDPSKDSLSAIRFLAGDLNSAMGTSSGGRIQLQAFGGAKGDKGSDARRLSLKRALAIRQVLIDDGVSPDRIGVSAMGGADDGPPDRVDVYLKS